jgi:hypothetical protein
LVWLLLFVFLFFVSLTILFAGVLLAKVLLARDLPAGLLTSAGLFASARTRDACRRVPSVPHYTVMIVLSHFTVTAPQLFVSNFLHFSARQMFQMFAVQSFVDKSASCIPVKPIDCAYSIDAMQFFPTQGEAVIIAVPQMIVADEYEE